MALLIIDSNIYFELLTIADTPNGQCSRISIVVVHPVYVPWNVMVLLVDTRSIRVCGVSYVSPYLFHRGHLAASGGLFFVVTVLFVKTRTDRRDGSGWYVACQSHAIIFSRR